MIFQRIVEAIRQLAFTGRLDEASQEFIEKVLSKEFDELQEDAEEFFERMGSAFTNKFEELQNKVDELQEKVNSLTADKTPVRRK